MTSTRRTVTMPKRGCRPRRSAAAAFTTHSKSPDPTAGRSRSTPRTPAADRSDCDRRLEDLARRHGTLVGRVQHPRNPPVWTRAAVELSHVAQGRVAHLRSSICIESAHPRLVSGYLCGSPRGCRAWHLVCRAGITTNQGTERRKLCKPQ